VVVVANDDGCNVFSGSERLLKAIEASTDEGSIDGLALLLEVESFPRKPMAKLVQARFPTSFGVDAEQVRKEGLSVFCQLYVCSVTRY